MGWLRRLDQPRAARVHEIEELAASVGVAVYLVGGVVRDLLLGRETTDLDFAVEGDPTELARRFAERHGAACREHRTFGTATVVFDDGSHVDLARTRRERYPHPGALPRVAAAGLDDDLRRRDFTVNSMALAISRGNDDPLIDPCGGREDLAAGRLRVLHEGSFVDDPTRAARAVRFSARLGFSIEPETRRRMHRCLAANGLETVSAARRRGEVVRLFDERDWSRLARALFRYRAWSVIDRDLAPGRRAISRLGRMERLRDWYAGLPRVEVPPGWVVAMVALGRRADPAVRRTWIERLRPARRDARDLLEASERAHALLSRLRGMRRVRPSLVRATMRGAGGATWLEVLDRTRPGRLRDALVEDLCRGRLVRADIDGTDLERAGFPRGPSIGKGLEAALEAKLDGRAPDATSQLAAARAAIGRA